MSSYWIETCKNLKITNQIDSNYNSDVCIIGAGICGLNIGYYLAKKGLKVIILDKDNILKFVEQLSSKIKLNLIHLNICLVLQKIIKAKFSPIL